MNHGFRLKLEHVTIDATSISGEGSWETRYLNIELWTTHNYGEEFLDSVVLEKEDILWLLESD